MFARRRSNVRSGPDRAKWIGPGIARRGVGGECGVSGHRRAGVYGSGRQEPVALGLSDDQQATAATIPTAARRIKNDFMSRTPERGTICL